MDVSSLTSSETVDRIDSGEGYIHEQSFEIGNAIIMIPNIGSMTIIDGQNPPWPFVVGAVLVLAGLVMLGGDKLLALVLIAGGIALLVWGFNRPHDVFLSIGTCDGRRTHIVSKDRKFLLAVSKFLREKIDRKSAQTGTVNINAGTISGGIAVGSSAQATGHSGNIDNG